MSLVFWVSPRIAVYLFLSPTISNILVHILQQSSKFASAVGKCRGFCRGISTFFCICLSKKKKCWGNWMMMMMFSTQITNLISWRRPFTVLSTYFCVLFSYFCCSLILVSKKWDIERRLTQGYRICSWANK